MIYNFDNFVDRKENFSAKWSEMKKNFNSNDLLPMWIADMDFKSAPCIIDAMQKRLEQGVFGYTTRPDSYNQSIIDWVYKRHGWKMKKEWLIFSPGVIPTISLLIQQLTKPGDSIIIQQPVYSPFSSVVKDNFRNLVISPLKKNEFGDYEMDYEDFEKKITKDVKLFILCNPHNPVGRVWRKDELEKIGKICIKHNIKVISDEIHSDIVYKGNKYTPFASISEDFAQNSISCFAPSKTFNIPGLQASVAVLPNEQDFKLLDEMFTRIDIKRNNCFSLVATHAAYTYGEEWLDELLIYLESNVDFVINYLKENLPQVKAIKPEGTYLMWLDFSSLNLSDEQISELMINKAKVAMNKGISFGDCGKSYQRMNIACPKCMVKEALDRIKSAIESL